jgi:hypothetical protein
MPRVLRLCREYPTEVRSSGSGSQRYFDPEVLPVLRRLYKADVQRERGAVEPGRAGVAAPTRSGSSGVARQAPSEGSDVDLARRIEALTHRLEAQAEEVGMAIEHLRRAHRFEVRLL